jgi:hypothetical protein
MANTFLRKLGRNIGTSLTAVDSYTVGANVGAVIVGLNISNTSAAQIIANVVINNGTDNFYLGNRIPVAAGGAVSIAGGDQKIILQTGDSVQVNSSTAGSVDVLMNIMETDGAGITADPTTYSITSNISSVNEGNTVGFTVSTSSVPNSTVLYWTTVGNVSSADFSDSVTSGNVTIANSSATITRTLAADATTEGVEYFDLALRTGSISGTIVATSGNVIVNDTSSATTSLLYTLDNPNAFDTSEGDGFGSAVAISGNYAIVSATEGDAGGVASGKAYIYSTQTGALLYTLNNPNAFGTSAMDYFGTSVAISGNLAIVGAGFEDDAGGVQSGKAYIYNISTFASNVISTATYTLNNPNAYSTSVGDGFGRGVAISGNLAIVGAQQEDDAGGTDSGKAYIYDISTFASNVISTATYTLNNPNAYSTSAGDSFGVAVAISGNLAIVGATQEDETGNAASGKAYIYSAVTGSLLYTLNNPNAYGTSFADRFGEPVAISGNYAIVGAVGEDDAGGNASGKAYIFNTNNGQLLYTLNNPNAYGTSQTDQFGTSVAISGNLAIVGAVWESDDGSSLSGKSYIYNISTFASNVISTATYTIDNPNAYGTGDSDFFGGTAAISGNLAIFGVYNEDDAGGNASGKAYIYNIS